MPNFEYYCPNCEHSFAKLVTLSAMGSVKCPDCNKLAIKQISAPAVHFKGSGFYASSSKQEASPKNKQEDKKSEKSEQATATKKVAGKTTDTKLR
jgi:putative FmdB family regulatory protein